MPWTEYQTRTATEDEIRAWFDSDRPPNVGIACGPVSGCVVVDCDSPQAEALVRSHLGEISVPFVRTGSGGGHLYFASPAEPVGNRVRVGGVALDVRGAGGQVVAPPSLHSSGRRYEWITPLGPLPALPSTLLQLLRGRNGPRSGCDVEPSAASREADLPDCDTSPYGRRALLRATMAIVRAEEGSRNDTLFTQAASIFELVAGAEISEAEAFRDLAAAAHLAGLGGAETGRTLLSARKHGAATPRRAPMPQPGRRADHG
jgi:hypothetical protein